MTKTKKAIDPFRIFVIGHNFLVAQHSLRDMGRASHDLMDSLALPTSVVSSFCCELYLKALLHIETGTALRGHNLRKLYDALSRKTRVKLQGLWDEYVESVASEWNRIEKHTGEKIARDLPSALSAGSRAFELMRYRYEDSPEDFQYYLHALPHMLGCVMLELKPEWKERYANLPKLTGDI